MSTITVGYARAIAHFDDMLNGVFSKAEFWRTHAQDKLTEREKKGINRLLDSGPDGFEGGMTTQQVCFHDALQ